MVALLWFSLKKSYALVYHRSRKHGTEVAKDRKRLDKIKVFIYNKILSIE